MFVIHLLQTARVELCFVDDLDGHLLPGGDVLGQLDLGEVSLADGLEQSVLADVGLVAASAPAAHAGGGGAVAALKRKETPLKLVRGKLFEFENGFSRPWGKFWGLAARVAQCALPLLIGARSAFIKRTIKTYPSARIEFKARTLSRLHISEKSKAFFPLRRQIEK